MAQLTVTVDGESVRRWFNLQTESKAAARRKMERLIAEHAAGAPLTADAARAPETVSSYAAAWLKGRESRGLPSAANERRHFERVWKGEVGELPLASVRAGMLQAVLDRAAEGGIRKVNGERYSRESITHMRATILRILETAWREELVTENVAKRTTVPDIDEDKRPRAVLTDEELVQLVGHPRVNAEIKLLTLLSRFIGGLRSGDLNRLQWPMFSPGFVTLTLVRAKTRKKKPVPVTFEVPADVRRSSRRGGGRPAAPRAPPCSRPGAAPALGRMRGTRPRESGPSACGSRRHGNESCWKGQLRPGRSTSIRRGGPSPPGSRAPA